MGEVTLSKVINHHLLSFSTLQLSFLLYKHINKFLFNLNIIWFYNFFTIYFKKYFNYYILNKIILILEIKNKIEDLKNYIF